MTAEKKSGLKAQTAGLLCVMGASVLWGSVSLYTLKLYEAGMNSMEITSVRLCGSALVMAVWFLLFEPSMFRIRMKDLWMFLGTGIASYVLYNWCYFSCMKQSSVSAAAVLLYTSPMFVMIFSALFFGEKLTGKKAAAFFMTIAGCALVTGLPGNAMISSKAAALGIGSGFAYALYTVFGHFALKRYRVKQVVFWTNLCGGAATILIVDMKDYAGKLVSLQTIPSELLLILLATIFPLLLYTKGLKKIEAGKASLAGALEPVAAAVIGIMVFKEPFGVHQFIGTALVLAAVLLIFRTEKEHRKIH